jgi:hypothetical protein
MTFCMRPGCLVAVLAAAGLSGQTLVDLQNQTKKADFANMPFTRPAKTGSTLPTTCIVGEMFFSTSSSPGGNLFLCSSTNTWSHSVGATIPATNLASLPAVCNVGDFYYITDASFATGGWRLFTCSSANTWNQVGVIADGTGYFTVNCAQPSNCLVGPNTAVVPSMPGPNTWTGSNNFSGASKTAMFRIAGSAPATCDATSREAYLNTTTNNIGICSSTNNWTDVGRSLLLYKNNSIGAVTANGSTQTLDSFVIPAGTLRVGDVIEIEANFTRTGSAAAITFGVNFGGSAVTSSAATTATGSVFKPTLVVTGATTEIWGGSFLINAANPIAVNPGSTAATAAIASAITVSLTQNGTGPDSGAVSSWFVKVTR